MSVVSFSGTVGHTNRSAFARRHNLFPCLFLIFGAIFSVPVSAAHLIGNIELDGNTANDGGAVAGIDDWDDVFAATDNALRSAFEVDSAAIDPTSFEGGVKDTQSLNQWTCIADTVQNKSDLLHAYAATYEVDGDLYFYGGGDRETTEGTANIGIWLFQEPISCVSAGPSTPFTGTHIDGDLLLVSEFDNGGRVENVKVYRWSDPDGTPQSGDECLGGDNGDCTDEGEPAFEGLNCLDTPAGDAVCGRTNPTSIVNAAWRAGIPTQGFYEVGINLSETLGSVGCYASALIETRSSTQLTATLKDFVVISQSTCGTLTVEKTTVGGNGVFGFTVNPSAGGPDAFDLSNGLSQEFITVEPGTYTVTEAVMPAGPPAPDGWNLTDISCTGGLPGLPTYVDDGHGGGYIGLEIDVGDDVTCTFTNTFTAPPNSITIQKVCEVSEPDEQTFNFALGGLFSGSSTLECASGTVTLACGESITCLDLGIGEHTIHETEPGLWTLVDVSCDGLGTLCGNGLAPHATITLGEGDSATATFTNQKQASIRFCKTTEPAGTGGTFDFTTDLGPYALAHGECVGPISVNPGVSYDLTEADAIGFILDGISCSGTNWTAEAAGTRTVTITPDSGEAVECEFVNVENPGYIRICKETEALFGGNPAFEVELSGPDDDLPASTTLQDGECDFGPGDDNEVRLTVGGPYGVTETAEPGWFTTVECIDVLQRGPIDPANINIVGGQLIACTFTNREGAPGVAIVKDGNLDLGNDGIAHPGDSIHYSFEVTNNGEVPLVNIFVTDNRVAVISCPDGNPIPLLNAGESQICSGSYAIAQIDIDDGLVENTASVSADCQFGGCNVMDSDAHIEPIPQVPLIVIEKTASPQEYGMAGEQITYTLQVSNQGNVTLYSTDVSDPLRGLGPISCPGGNPIPQLAPGASVSCIATYQITQNDIVTGQVTNTATAQTNCPAPPGRGRVCSTDDDSETVSLLANRATFRVIKDFDDDNPLGVDVTITCNTGVPMQGHSVLTDESTTGDFAEFVVQGYDSGELNCQISEAVPSGYEALYTAAADTGVAGNVTEVANGCRYEAVITGEFTCTIVNTLLPVKVKVKKKWIDDDPDIQSLDEVLVTLTCPDEIVDGKQHHGSWSKGMFIGPDNPGTWFVYPSHEGTDCSVEEHAEAGVVADLSDCEPLRLVPGEGGYCVILNTRIYAGIPVINEFGMLVLISLMLGIGMVALRIHR